MQRPTRALIVSAAIASLALPQLADAQEQDLQKRIDSLTKELQALKQREQRLEEKSLSRWLTVSGDYRFRIDSLHADVPDYLGMGPTGFTPVAGYSFKNNTIMTNRLGINLKAKATENVTVTTRFVMYKTFGMQTADAVNAGFFADRSFLFDGTSGHIPQDNVLRVDQAYATWSNIFDQPLWFSVGRRPSTGGSPTHVRQNNPPPGNGGVPGLLVDYAFDGMTIGWAPDVEFLPGAYAKLCYGRGFEAGYNTLSRLADTDMLGVQVIPLDTDKLRLDFQWNRGFNIFDNPNAPSNQLGDIDWWGVGALSSLKGVGPGQLTIFASGALSVTHPNGKTMIFNGQDTGAGLLFNPGSTPSDQTGYGLYVGARYDLPSGTKIGAEYNHGSQYWLPFDPAADDLWTSKLGTRGNVYEVYLIQELPLKPIASFLSKAFFKLGYQYYDFAYTGSSNWVGAPTSISDVRQMPQMMVPVKTAHDIYGTFEVRL